MAHLGKVVSLTSTDGTTFDAYDAGAGKAGVVLVHEWWGLEPGMKEIADELARNGFRALAVDLFGGQVATDTETAQRYMQALDKNAALKKIDAAAAHLPGAVATIGWCMGGGLALRAALAQPKKVVVAVNVYGETVEDPAVLRTLANTFVLGLFAEKDAWITKAIAEGFDRALKAAGVDHRVKIYPGVDHAFMNPRPPRHDPKAAADAWALILETLKTRLAA